MNESLMIVLHLLGALGVVYFCGFGIARLCGRGSAWMPILGYCAGQSLFFLFYFEFFDANMAVAGVLAVAAVLNVVGLWPRANGAANHSGRVAGGREIVLLAAVGIFVLMMAAWPYFLAGSGNYWHTGNEDAFDAINGRDAYIFKEVPLQEYWELMRTNAIGFDATKDAVVQDPAKQLVAVYADDFGRLQYSSTAFWSIMLDVREGMDAWLIQALLNLLLMTHGLILLIRRALPMGAQAVAVVATAAVTNHFYLATYLNGHQGSLMFAAVAPYGLLLTLDLMGKLNRSLIRNGLALTILLLFVLGAYPYPLLFFLIGVFFYWLHRRFFENSSPRPYVARLGLILLALIYAGAWYLFEPIRDRADDQFRSWMTVYKFIGFFQFWGLWPSLLVSADLDFLNVFIASVWAVSASHLIAASLSGLAVYGFYRAVRAKDLLFPAFATMWLVLFPLMRFIVGDSYYFYKFLYMTNCFVVALTIYGYIHLKAGNFPRKVVWFATAVVGIWGGLNLVNNIWATRNINNRLYNSENVEFRALIPALRDVSAQTYVDLPKRGSNGSQLTDFESIIRNYFWSAGLRVETDAGQARYLLRMNNYRDVIEPDAEEVIWESGLFRLIKAPQSNFSLIRSLWAPEIPGGGPRNAQDNQFRWVSDGKNNWFSVIIVRPSDRQHYLHFCAESGPGLDFRPLPLVGRDADGKELAQFTVDTFGCFSTDIAGRRGPFRFSSNVVGRVVSQLDMRHLNFRVFHVGVTDAPYDLATLRHLNALEDITPKATAAALQTFHARPSSSIPPPGTVYLRNNWYPFEKFSGDSFRWVRNDAEIALFRRRGERHDLELDIEPGPSLGKETLSLHILDERGREVASASVTGRKTLNLDIPPGNEAFQLLRIHAVDSDNLSIPNDPRILNFRVFRIGIAPAAKP